MLWTQGKSGRQESQVPGLQSFPLRSIENIFDASSPTSSARMNCHSTAQWKHYLPLYLSHFLTELYDVYSIASINHKHEPKTAGAQLVLSQRQCFAVRKVDALKRYQSILGLLFLAFFSTSFPVLSLSLSLARSGSVASLVRI